MGLCFFRQPFRKESRCFDRLKKVRPEAFGPPGMSLITPCRNETIMEAKPPGDDYRIRCPRLGHQISFSYCREENRGIPCFKTLDCWHRHFPVEAYLRETLTDEEWRRSFDTPSKTKMASLLELIEQAKQAREEE